jgi:hypothetical protein
VTPDLSSFYEAWWWLYKHPAFFKHGIRSGQPGFFEALDVSVQKVNPKTGVIDDDPSKNTRVEIWLEVGPWGDPASEELSKIWGDIPPDHPISHGIATHDYELDCGGATYEEAIIKMATLVKEHYGTY